MSSTITDLMNANLLAVFNERDDIRRRTVIEQTYSNDVTFADPEGTTVGRDELDRKARELLEGAPDFVFSPAGPVLVSQDLGHLAWNFGPEGAPPVVSGIDIATVVDGRIATLHTLLTKMPDAT